MEERWWKVNQNGPRFSMSNEKKTPGCLGCIYIYTYIVDFLVHSYMGT